MCLEAQLCDTFRRCPLGKKTASLSGRPAGDFAGIEDEYRMNLGIVVGMAREEVCSRTADDAALHIEIEA